MDLELLNPRTQALPPEWAVLLKKTGLTPGEPAERTVLLWDDDGHAATGSRDGNLIKYMAVDPLRQGEDLTASLLTNLRQDAFSCGISHLFLYTKPRNRLMFQNLFFYPVAETGDVLNLTISLTFIEFSTGKTSKLADTSEGTGSGGNASAAEKARATYEATVAAKNEAKNATASAVDRAGKKVAMLR